MISGDVDLRFLIAVFIGFRVANFQCTQTTTDPIPFKYKSRYAIQFDHTFVKTSKTKKAHDRSKQPTGGSKQGAQNI